MSISELEAKIEEVLKKIEDTQPENRTQQMWAEYMSLQAKLDRA